MSCEKAPLEISTFISAIPVKCHLCSAHIKNTHNPFAVQFVSFPREDGYFDDDRYPMCFRCIDLYIWECSDHDDKSQFHLLKQ
jgi:hypothetical protein